MVKYNYDAWGNCNVITSINNIAYNNPFRYRGYYMESYTGLYYLKTRFYNPKTGRFISPDDTKYLQPDVINGLNLYAYCNNNPVMNVDPNGNFAILTGLLIGAIVGATAGVGYVGYKDYKDDGKIFNGSIAWYDYLGAGLAGGIIGGAIGAGIGYLAPSIGSLLSTSSTAGGKLLLPTASKSLIGTAFKDGIKSAGFSILQQMVLDGKTFKDINWKDVTIDGMLGFATNYFFAGFGPNDTKNGNTKFLLKVGNFVLKKLLADFGKKYL